MHPQRLARLNDIALRMDIKTIDVKGDTASAVYTWVSSFKLANAPSPSRTSSGWTSSAPPTGWKILSGI